MARSSRAALALMEIELQLRAEQRASRPGPLQEHQLPPPGDWSTWLFCGGQGTGKTHTGSVSVINHLRQYGKGARVIIAGATRDDVRKVCLEGLSGIMTLAAPDEIKLNRSTLEGWHEDGGRIYALGAEVPERFRGPEATLLWADEIRSWNPDSWDVAVLRARLEPAPGVGPRKIVTSTPRPCALMQDMIADAKSHPERTVVSYGAMADNIYLSPKARAEYYEKFGGTKMAAQELFGQMTYEDDGAMWRSGMIDPHRRSNPADWPEWRQTVLAIDPAVTTGPRSDETGLAVASVGADGHYYLRHSDGGRWEPEKWSSLALTLFREYACDYIVVETNQGGQMVKSTLENACRQLDTRLPPTKDFSAIKSKPQRALPISLLYQQGRVHHCGVFIELESQMMQLKPDHDDRLDAAVYALAEVSCPAPDFSKVTTLRPRLFDPRGRRDGLTACNLRM